MTAPASPLAAVNPTVSLRTVRRLAVLGDSTAVGLGDPLPGGRWRGVGPLVAEALGLDAECPDAYLNAAFTGARVACVRERQLPDALRFAPDVTMVVVGMNDTLRSDFDAARLAEDLDAVVAELVAAGSLALVLRYHDHSRVFRLPGPLARALRGRIEELNAAVDVVVTRRGAPCLDLVALAGTYDLTAWSVDRLHPSELGHRMLAHGFSELIGAAGFRVVEPVGLACSGGVSTGAVEHVGWLVVQGIPWVWRRGRDFLPYAAAVFARSTVRSLAGYATTVAAVTVRQVPLESARSRRWR